MSTGYLAPLAPMVIPDNQYTNFIFNILIHSLDVLLSKRARTNKDRSVVVVVISPVLRYPWKEVKTGFNSVPEKVSLSPE